MHRRRIFECVYCWKVRTNMSMIPIFNTNLLHERSGSLVGHLNSGNIGGGLVVDPVQGLILSNKRCVHVV